MKTHFLRMPFFDAIELSLVIILIAAALGIIYKENFLYVVLGMIIILALVELHRDLKERSGREHHTGTL
jgi:hypothetical protein